MERVNGAARGLDWRAVHDRLQRLQPVFAEASCPRWWRRRGYGP